MTMFREAAKGETDSEKTARKKEVFKNILLSLIPFHDFTISRKASLMAMWLERFLMGFRILLVWFYRRLKAGLAPPNSASAQQPKP